MTDVRSGSWATRDGREFPVRHLRDDRWREVVGRKLVPPEFCAADFDTLVGVQTLGSVGGHEFEITSAPGDQVYLHSLSVDRTLASELGLEGNRHDGWGGPVAVSRVTSMHEVVTASRAPGRRR